MARSRESLMAEIRAAQKQLTAAKKRGNHEKESYLRSLIAKLRKDLEALG